LIAILGCLLTGAFQRTDNAAALSVIEPLILAASKSKDWVVQVSPDDTNLNLALLQILKKQIREVPVRAPSTPCEYAVAAEIRMSITLGKHYGMVLAVVLPPRKPIVGIDLGTNSLASSLDRGNSLQNFGPLQTDSVAGQIQSNRWDPLKRALREMDAITPIEYGSYMRGLKKGSPMKRSDLDPLVRASLENNIHISSQYSPYHTDQAMWREMESTPIDAVRLVLDLDIEAHTKGDSWSVHRIPLYNGKDILPGGVGPPLD
jgi:hypothetical protein